MSISSSPLDRVEVGLPYWLRRSIERAGWLRRRVSAAPPVVTGFVVATMLLAVLSATDLVYQVARKPSEMLFPFGSSFNKSPAETWRHYEPLFRIYSTATITPELLAALAQVEGAGNPLAHTYWRWQLTWHPLAIFAPASSAVGMYQMTDAAFAEARRYCMRDHAVVEDGCRPNDFYSRIVPGDAVELAALFLDRNVQAILGHRPKARVSARQKQDLAALIHLCGAGPAMAFARRGYHLTPNERCGDREAATYLARVNALKRQFLRLAADR
ncbi:MAG: lytic transglycosylase domain-containing protein [Alphaproteobacteria bacterium]